MQAQEYKNIVLHRLFHADEGKGMININKTVIEALTMCFTFQRRKEFESVNKRTTRCSVSAIIAGRPGKREKETRRERGTRKGRTGTKRNAIDGRETIAGKDKAPLVHLGTKITIKYFLIQFCLHEMAACLAFHLLDLKIRGWR